MNSRDPAPDSIEARLLEATRRSTLDEALSWIGDGYALIGDEQQVLRNLAALPDTPERRRASQTLTRRLSTSNVDSAAVLFRLDTVAPASDFRAALDHLASVCRDGTLRTTDAKAVLAAQRDESFTMQALCAVAGLSYSDLQERAAGLPADPKGPWEPSQIKAAFAVIDAVVTGAVESGLSGAVAMQPFDLIGKLAGQPPESGWSRVEAQRSGGVPYEVLLGQRVAGGAWLAHRNTTSGLLNHPIAQSLCDALDERGISYLRASSVGGSEPLSRLQTMTGADAQIGVLALDSEGAPAYAVAFSSARDSGTASKNANRLRNMARNPELPMAVVVAGPGWSARNETADLAMAFGGRLFSDHAIDYLAIDIEEVISAERGTQAGRV